MRNWHRTLLALVLTLVMVMGMAFIPNTAAPVAAAGSSSTGNSYPAWSSSATYAIGDLVVYENKVYECTYGHTANVAWTPTAAFTLWKQRADLAYTPTTATTTASTTRPSTQPTAPSGGGNNYTANDPLPAHFVTGYWHNFLNGSTALRLSDVPSCYDLICVSFTGNTSVAGEVTFALDGDLCNALNGYNKAQFIQDIATMKARGQHVIISVGGAEGRITINDTTSANRFANGLISIIEEYGFEGVDIDLEGSAVSGVNYIANALRTVQQHFGSSFIITMAPEVFYLQADRLSYNDITTAYLRLALSIKDILTVCHPQFYNSGSMVGYGGAIVNVGTADFITSLISLYVDAGLRPEQLAIGVPSTSRAAGSGYVSNSTLTTAVNALVNGTSSGSFTVPQAYRGLRGVMTWSINWDATNGYSWGNAMSALMDTLGGGSAPTTASTTRSTTRSTTQSTTRSTTRSTTQSTTRSTTRSTTQTTTQSTTRPTTAPTTSGSSYPTWDSSAIYVGGDHVVYNGVVYRAKWWTTGENPETCGQWGVWAAE